MSGTRFTSSKFPWAAITGATRSCAPLIVLDITALVYPTWLLMSPWIIQILFCLSLGMSLRIAIVNDALSCLTAVCLLVCICRPFIRLHYVMKSSSIWLMMCVCVCVCVRSCGVFGWVGGFGVLFTCQCQGRASQPNPCKLVSLIVAIGAILTRFTVGWDPLLTGRLGTCTSSPPADCSIWGNCPFWAEFNWDDGSEGSAGASVSLEAKQEKNKQNTS